MEFQAENFPHPTIGNYHLRRQHCQRGHALKENNTSQIITTTIWEEAKK